ncbi:MAG: hypothetical protein WC804_04345 [Sphingomonas sp.]|jgi:hypothetical protein|uniref:hypothetical protein n=1 Tax=Sphingomonas sp. TaxID=28214 RepID=UPI003563EA4D
MYFIIQSDEREDGYVVISESNQWTRWLSRNIPPEIDREIRLRLISNLKHLLTGLELKAALIMPHAIRGPGDRPVLFEPYFQNLILEFCVASFSVMEGLGSAHWLAREGLDGSAANRIARPQWSDALCQVYDENGEQNLAEAIVRTLAVRDKLHQDRLGLREDIDWHSLSFEAAFVPASNGLRTILQRNADVAPAASNLPAGPT